MLFIDLREPKCAGFMSLNVGESTIGMFGLHYMVIALSLCLSIFVLVIFLCLFCYSACCVNVRSSYIIIHLWSLCPLHDISCKSGLATVPTMARYGHKQRRDEQSVHHHQMHSTALLLVM